MNLAMAKILSNSAYSVIKDCLLNSEVYPGQKISHLELGKRFGLGQTPLREALVRLSAEGLLTHYNQKGFYIPEISLQEAKELFEAIWLIETHLVGRAAFCMPARQIAVLKEVLSEYEELVQGPYTHRRLLVDKRFHMEIVSYGGNESLKQILERIYDRTIIKEASHSPLTCPWSDGIQ